MTGEDQTELRRLLVSVQKGDISPNDCMTQILVMHTQITQPLQEAAHDVIALCKMHMLRYMTQNPSEWEGCDWQQVMARLEDGLKGN